MKKTLLAIAVVLGLAACQPAAEQTEPTPEPTNTPQPTDEPAPTADWLDVEVGSGDPIGDEEAEELMFILTEDGPAAQQEAVVRILEADDERFIAVFIELLHADLVGLTTRALFDERITALERLSGESFGRDWSQWVQWYGTTDLSPPPGFLEWKGRLFSRIDFRFFEFMLPTFEETADLRVEEIVWGGVSVDGIPALDNAEMIDPEDAGYLQPEEAVFGLVINGDARAYPLRIMDWHEMANDVVGGVPVSIAYCTLCGSAIAYNGEASDGETYTFGSSGLLYRSNKLMYDRQTNTLWNQLTGEPVLGELSGSDVELEILPLVLTSFEEWQAQHPDTVVLSLDTGSQRIYDPAAPYGDYFASDEPLFPVWQRSDILEDKTQVFALRLNNDPKVYPLETLRAERVVNDEVGGQPLVIVAPGDEVIVEGTSMRSGQQVTYSAGSEVRAYDAGDFTFTPGDDSTTLIDQNGDEWEITPDALLGPGGEELPRLGGHLAFWFGWFSFFPNTAVYGTTE